MTAKLALILMSLTSVFTKRSKLEKIYACASVGCLVYNFKEPLTNVLAYYCMLSGAEMSIHRLLEIYQSIEQFKLQKKAASAEEVLKYIDMIHPTVGELVERYTEEEIMKSIRSPGVYRRDQILIYEPNI